MLLPTIKIQLDTTLLLIAVLGAIWGSFLNVVAYRLINNQTPFFPQRSYCPHCKKTLRWYELVPIFSFIFLRGSCSSCKKNISPLYPFIELLTAGIFVYYRLLLPINQLPTSLFFASLLIITIRTDFEDRSIFRLATLFSIPIAYLVAYLNFAPISLLESITSSICAYIFLRLIRFFASWYAKQEALGLGDVELIAFIAAVSGFWGAWTSLALGAFFGTLHGIFFHRINKNDPRIPFGAYLALAQIFLLPLTNTIFFYFQK